MSTQGITRFPPGEILFVIIGSIDNPADLLALALTCRFIYEMIIPQYLSYFRIAARMGDISLWKHLSQNLHLCRNIQEIELTDFNPSVYRSPLEYDPWYGVIQTASPDLPVIVQHMVNLRRAKFWQCSDVNFEIIRDILDALVDSKSRLEEFDLALTTLYPSNSKQMRETALEPVKLQIWLKLNLTALRKLFMSIGKRTRGPSWNRRPRSLFREVIFITNMLSNAPALTHLSLTIIHTVAVNLFDFTCPNLENVIIIDSVERLSTYTPQDPSILISFFQRHPKLTTLSLPSYVYTPTSSPYITLESLPRLESLAYNKPVQVPLAHVLSPASARKLHHLTINDGDALLENSDMDIYKELTSLQTCCLTSDSLRTNYDNINRILANFVIHITNVQKIHLPTHGSQDFRDSSCLKTLSILKCLPKLTHLSGISLWIGNPTHDLILRELYQFFQLKYVVTPLPPLSVFRLIRDDKAECMLVEDGPLAGRNSDCDMTTWGNFYRGMVF